MKLLIKGLLLGFRKKLKLVGVGYRGYHLENFLVLKIGYSHEVFYFIPFDIKLICFKSRG
jgi:large subunit ribosomal protein L6